ncbi:hypothetical protein HHK36_013115 [Tetracentron sinense]|uniref:Protein TIC 22-like, chloroplastic n=1 Tax=Tetracentron sinense TaxID=13715 RepID=A0A835DG66_TETSI|nr:hypothetical protein HHK36_013115 [Tetracentron sinense]
MQFPKFKKTELSSDPKQAKPSLQQTFINIQNHCSGFLQQISKSLPQQQHHQPNFPLFNPNPSALKTHVEFALLNLGNQAKQAFQGDISGFGSGSSSRRNPAWAQISEQRDTPVDSVHRFDLAMSTESIEERLAGVPVYALSNSAEEFVLVSGVKTGKSLGLFCFKREDADALLEQMKSMDPGMRRGSRVVTVALNKVFQLKVDGVAFRLIPDPSQIKHAVKVSDFL